MYKQVGIGFLVIIVFALFYHPYTGLSSAQAKQELMDDKMERLYEQMEALRAQNARQIRSIKGASGDLKEEEQKLEEAVSDVKEEILETNSVVSIEDSTLKNLQERLEKLEKIVETCNCGSSDASNTKIQAPASTTGHPLESELVPPAFRMYGAAPPNKVSQVKREPVDTNSIYDGESDAEHLGGSTKNDTMGQSPSLWTFLLKDINVRTVIDVGCGRGISTRWFEDHGADVLCLEGSSDAIEKSHLKREKVVQHDFTLGPYWPEKTYDLAWSVEFLEHVGRQYMKYYTPIFHKSAILYVTHSLWGGHHHVEVHEEWWWIARMQAQGFVYSAELTKIFRKAAGGSKGDGFNGQHLWLTGLAFINPKVASLPEHAHLFGGPGCFTGRGGKHNIMCEGADALPEQFLPVLRSPTKWDTTSAKELNLQDKPCRSNYGFPTGHDGCSSLKRTFLRRLSEYLP